jgi:hypothetical protein
MTLNICFFTSPSNGVTVPKSFHKLQFPYFCNFEDSAMTWWGTNKNCLTSHYDLTDFCLCPNSPTVSLNLIFLRFSDHTYLDTPHSAWLLWTSDQPVAETSTWQQATLFRDKHPCPGGIWTHNPSKRVAADKTPLITNQNQYNRKRLLTWARG